MRNHLLCCVCVDATVNMAEGALGTTKTLKNVILCRAKASFKRAVDVLAGAEDLTSARICARG